MSLTKTLGWITAVVLAVSLGVVGFSAAATSVPPVKAWPTPTDSACSSPGGWRPTRAGPPARAS